MANNGVRFAKDGPLIPVKLLHTLEEGELTIFCGAGVSRCCGLPDFRGLVHEVCCRMNRPMQPDEKELFDRDLFDAALGLIESRIVGPLLRRTVAEILEVKAGSDLQTHEALLELATSAQKRLRLVTTNFDRAFEMAGASGKPTFDYAPYLPLPGREWNSVVHLHGGLGNAKDTDRKSLVLTSADFGRAYITEGWASRFLTELFRRSAAVLFVGYSVSDPAIRYIVDAFAADRCSPGTHVAVAYVLSGSAVPEKEERTWKSRGIVPISYRCDPPDDHTVLHETLRSCAAKYRTGFFDRASIVLKHGSNSPIGALDGEAISQITWALRDATGHAARRFAKLNPPAPIDWLETLWAKGLLNLAGPGQQGVPAVARLPRSRLTPSLHPATEGLCEWICVHLASPRLISWIVENGCHLHPEFARRVRDRLADSSKSRQLPKGAELIWRLLSAPRAPVHNRAIADEVAIDLKKLGSADWNPLMRDHVLSWLAPTIEFMKPYRPGTAEDFETESVTAYVRLELVPAAGRRSREVVDKLLGRPDADLILGELLGEFTGTLLRGMAYLKFLSVADADADGTFSGRPSIDDHPQNDDRFRQWPVYVHLLRAAWLRVSGTDPEVAREEVTRWTRLPFPIFSRFVLWSAGKPCGISAAESVEYLTKQPPSTLWGLDTRRELLQYLRRVGELLSPEDKERLLTLIIAGPPRTQYRAEVTDEKFAELRDKAIHIRIATLRDRGHLLPAFAQAAWDDILSRHPGWPLGTTERDEFWVWTSRAEFVSPYPSSPLPTDYLEWADETIISDLAADPTSPETVRRWRGILNGDISRGIRVLEILGKSGIFEVEIWTVSLEYLGGQETVADCLRLYSAFGTSLGTAFIIKNLGKLADLISWYYRGKTREHEDLLWHLYDLLLEPAALVTPDEDADPIVRALNSPIGSLAEALLVKLGELGAKTYEEIPEPFRARMESLLGGSRPAHRLSRLILARALGWLHRLKPDLVVPSFLERFDPDTSPEWRGLWLGYLMGWQITPELWLPFRPLFLKVVAHSGTLGDYEDHFYSLFAFLLMNAEFGLESAEGRRALAVGSAKGRAQVAWCWCRQADSNPDYGAKSIPRKTQVSAKRCVAD